MGKRFFNLNQKEHVLRSGIYKDAEGAWENVKESLEMNGENKDRKNIVHWKQTKGKHFPEEQHVTTARVSLCYRANSVQERRVVKDSL